MKILHITNSAFSLPYFLGDQIGFFKERDHDVEVCCPPSKDFKDFTNLHDIRGYEIMLSRRYSILSDLRAFLSLVSIIKEQKYDCVVGHTPKGALLAMLASYVVKVRVRLYFRHGIVYINQFGLPRYVLKSIERLTSFLSTDVICVSNYLVAVS